MPRTISRTINAGHKEAPGLVPYWNMCVGAGRANEGLRANWLDHLSFVKTHCGFRYVRFHGLFHDDMFVYSENNGVPQYNWQYIDELFDRMLELGVRPFVELGFCPAAMASTPATIFWWKGHSSPPSDYGKWAKLVEAFARHCIARYGVEEVIRWYFEVWNEPNLQPFWDGTKSQYFELYRVSASVLKSVDTRLRVGGPATSNFVCDDRFAGEREDVSKQMTWKGKGEDPAAWRGVWIEDFLAYCAANVLPVDFISTHPYPSDWALDGHGIGKGMKRHKDSLKHDLEWLRRAISTSAFPKAEIHLTEWSSSPSSRDHTHDHLQECAYVLRSISLCIGLCDSISYWTFTDVFEESGAGALPFHGGFGLVNLQGLPKPAFHGYRMLNRLGDRLLHADEHLIASIDSRTSRFSMVAWNYPEEVVEALCLSDEKPDLAQAMLATGLPAQLEVVISGLNPDTRFEIEFLDTGHGSARDEWVRLGMPQTLSREQVLGLRSIVMHTRRMNVRSNGCGVLSLSAVLGPWEVCSVRQMDIVL